jgi:hypothetical protein
MVLLDRLRSISSHCRALHAEISRVIERLLAQCRNQHVSRVSFISETFAATLRRVRARAFFDARSAGATPRERSSAHENFFHRTPPQTDADDDSGSKVRESAAQ